MSAATFKAKHTRGATQYGGFNTETRASVEPEDFTPHSSLALLFVSAVALLVLLIAFGQPGAAFIALSVVVVLAVSYLSKPAVPFTYHFEVGSASGRSTANTSYSTLTLTGPPEGGSAIVEVHFPGSDPLPVHVWVGEERTIEFWTTTLRTGPREQFSVRTMPFNTSGDWFGIWETLTLPRTLVLPPITPLQHIPVAAVATGLTGPRTTRKAGSGTEFRDLGAMAWGDSTRRIDWKASARDTSGNEQLFVRRTLAQSEATTIIMLDSRDEVGPEVATWGGSGEIRADHKSSLDLAREAAVSLAQHAITSGDRVGFEDVSRPKRPIPPSTGQRHLKRLTHAIAITAPIGTPAERVRPPMVPTGSIVYLLSTFLDDSSQHTITALIARGHRVVAVDVLPNLSTWDMTDRQRSAFRLVQVHREARLREVRHLGVPLIAWVNPERSRLLAQHAAATRRHR